MDYHKISDIYMNELNLNNNSNTAEIIFEKIENINYMDIYKYRNYKNDNDNDNDIFIIKFTKNYKTYYNNGDDNINEYIIYFPYSLLFFETIVPKDNFVDLYRINIKQYIFRLKFCDQREASDCKIMNLFEFTRNDYEFEKLTLYEKFTFNIFVEPTKPYEFGKMKKSVKLKIDNFIFYYKIRVLNKKLVELILFCISNTITNENIIIDIKLDDINTIYSKYEIAIKKIYSFLILDKNCIVDITQLKKQIDGNYRFTHVLKYHNRDNY